MVISLFLFLALSVGIGFLQGSLWPIKDSSSKEPAPVEEGLIKTMVSTLIILMKPAQAANKDEKIKGYLTIGSRGQCLKAAPSRRNFLAVSN